MTKKAIIALLSCVFALSLALVGCSSGGAASSAPTEEQMKAEFAGTWDLTGMTEDGKDVISADDLELMKQMGLSVTLILNEDGTGAFEMYGEKMEGTWKVSSMTEGTFTAEDQDIAMKLADGKLTLEQENEAMIFEKGTASSASSSASAAA